MGRSIGVPATAARFLEWGATSSRSGLAQRGFAMYLEQMSESTLSRRPYRDAVRRDIAAFIARTTRGHVTWADLVLRRLIAGPEAVCDLWRGEERAGVAVSLDNCATEGNAAELSVFTAVPGDREALEALLAWGESRGLAAGRSNIDVPAWPGTPLPPDQLASRGYRLGHITYEMERPADAPAPPAPRRPLPHGWRWQEASERCMASFHETAQRALAGIPGAFVPDLDTFRLRQEAADPPAELLLGTDPDTPVAAFVRVELAADGAGVLGVLGRHPRYRGLGLGGHIVSRGLARLRALSATAVRLEVSAQNRPGLSLYESYGFRVVLERPVYRRPVRGLR